jgi:hypothetical protein
MKALSTKSSQRLRRLVSLSFSLHPPSSPGQISPLRLCMQVCVSEMRGIFTWLKHASDNMLGLTKVGVYCRCTWG